MAYIYSFSCYFHILQEIFVHPLILTIRDTDTVENLKTKLRDAKRIVVVGNGGIATEIV